jgi:CubicO group peptidase (beta-lactamase class C family)
MPISRIEDIISTEMALQRIPGISIAIGSQGDVVYARGFGDRDIASRDAVAPGTIFPIASISKQVTAAMVLYLAERGRLSIDDRISQYFPGLEAWGGVSVQHLLGQTSGIPGYTEAETFDQVRYSPALPQNVVDTVADLPLGFAPGTEWQYSNTNYVLLAMLVEAVAGEPYGDFLARNFLEPLGLADTGCLDRLNTAGEVANGYTTYALGPVEPARPWDPVWAFGAGGLYSTVYDLLRWNSALRNERVVNADSFSRMATSGVLTGGQATGYGFGLRSESIMGLRQIRHSGGLPGFSLGNVSYPELGLDIAILTNLDGIDPYLSMVRPILAAILERPEIAVSKWNPDSTGMSAREESLLRRWLGNAEARDFDALRQSDSFKRFLNSPRRARIASVFERIDLKNAQLLSWARQEPVTSFQFKTDVDGQAAVASLTLSELGETHFLDVRAWGARRLSQ